MRTKNELMTRREPQIELVAGVRDRLATSECIRNI